MSIPRNKKYLSSFGAWPYSFGGRYLAIAGFPRAYSRTCFMESSEYRGTFAEWTSEFLKYLLWPDRSIFKNVRLQYLAWGVKIWPLTCNAKSKSFLLWTFRTNWPTVTRFKPLLSSKDCVTPLAMFNLDSWSVGWDTSSISALPMTFGYCGPRDVETSRFLPAVFKFELRASVIVCYLKL